MRYYEAFPPYVPVAQRRAKAEKQLRQMQKKNPRLKPVILTGNSLASTWWGKSWNSNLERYADYNNRIGRGRSYVRHHAVLDLQLASGKSLPWCRAAGRIRIRLPSPSVPSADNWRTSARPAKVILTH
jgi:hypothetical protein